MLGLVPDQISKNYTKFCQYSNKIHIQTMYKPLLQLLLICKMKVSRGILLYKHLSDTLGRVLYEQFLDESIYQVLHLHLTYG